MPQSARSLPPQALLALRAVHVRFGKLDAVAGVSMRLNAGELLGLIGPNGAGKTTLLRAAAGLQSLTSGTVSVMGESLTEGAEALRHIGFTPDTPPLYEEMTVRQFLRFIAKGYDLPTSEANERIAFWTERVWLMEKLDQKVRALSRGMRQRLGIARTLLPNPHIIILDEPAAGLDPAGRAQFRQLLVDLRAQGKAIIVSSHLLSDMAEYCTHVAIMSAGRIQKYGTVAEVAAGSAAADGRCRYTVYLARPATVADGQTLSALEGVLNVRVERDHITFEYRDDRAAAAQLLAEMIRRQFPVASFAPKVIGLEEAYLRSGIKQVD